MGTGGTYCNQNTSYSSLRSRTVAALDLPSARHPTVQRAEHAMRGGGPRCQEHGVQRQSVFLADGGGRIILRSCLTRSVPHQSCSSEKAVPRKTGSHSAPSLCPLRCASGSSSTARMSDT
eukprot:scaffold69623_cov52-Phaeocystis_antarctica.AAC.2